jgi:DNA-binding transcriptional LysR family regulator
MRRATGSQTSWRGRLVEVLGDFPPTPTPVSVLYPSRRQLPPRVRVFVD